MALLTNAELAAVQAVGQLGMVTTVIIYSVSEELGLESTDDEYGSSIEVSSSGTTANGWLVGRWQNDRDVAAGDVDTTTLYRLRLPVGTSIEPGWDVAIGGNRYSVIDVGSDQTWPEWLNCNLRRSK